MALITTVSGPYVGTMNGLALGVTGSGFALSWTVYGHHVNDTTSWAKTLIEGVFTGADWSVAGVFREANSAGLLESMYPWGRRSLVARNKIPYLMNNLGRRYTTQATPLILTAASGTPASASPATLTALAAILAPGSYSMALDSRSRDVAVRYSLIPYYDTAVQANLWFTTT